MDDTLDSSEELALVGLLRLMVRLDRQGSPEERDAYRSALRAALAPVSTDPTATYRESPAAPTIDEAHIAALEGRADQELSTDESVRIAALAVTRQSARDTIFAALSDLSAAEGPLGGEIALLDWLAAEWSIVIHEVPEAQ